MEYLDNREHTNRLVMTPSVNQALQLGKLDETMSLQQQKNALAIFEAVDIPVDPEECVRNLKGRQTVPLPRRLSPKVYLEIARYLAACLTWFEKLGMAQGWVLHWARGRAVGNHPKDEVVSASTTLGRTAKCLLTFLHPDFTAKVGGFDPLRDSVRMNQAFVIAQNTHGELQEVYREYPKDIPLETWEDIDGAVFYNPCPTNQPSMFGEQADPTGETRMPTYGTMISPNGLPLRELPSFHAYELYQRFAGTYAESKFSSDIDFIATNKDLRYGWAETSWEVISAGLPRVGHHAVPEQGIFGLMQSPEHGRWSPIRPYGLISKAVNERQGNLSPANHILSLRHT